MNKKIKELATEIVVLALKSDETFLIDNVKFTLVEEVLKRSVSIGDASKILGVTKASIHNMKKSGVIADVKREKGKRFDTEEK